MYSLIVISSHIIKKLKPAGTSLQGNAFHETSPLSFSVWRAYAHSCWTQQQANPPVSCCPIWHQQPCWKFNLKGKRGVREGQVEDFWRKFDVLQGAEFNSLLSLFSHCKCVKQRSTKLEIMGWAGTSKLKVYKILQNRRRWGLNKRHVPTIQMQTNTLGGNTSNMLKHLLFNMGFNSRNDMYVVPLSPAAARLL